MAGVAELNKKFYDVVSLETYTKNPDIYVSGHVAIEDEDYVLPILSGSASNNVNKIGIEVGPTISRVYLPTSAEDKKAYSKDKLVDFSKATSYDELANLQQTVINMEKDVLTNPDNTSVYPIDEKDSPAMKLLKEAVNKKHINLDNYEHRFGSNYNNDKRIFNKNTVSLTMMERMADALDMKLTLTLQDSKPDVPNPIGTAMSIDITGGSYECE